MTEIAVSVQPLICISKGHGMPPRPGFQGKTVRILCATRSSKDTEAHLFAVVEGLEVHQNLYGLDIAPLVIPTILAIARL